MIQGMAEPMNPAHKALTGMIVPVFVVLLLQFLGLPDELEYRRPVLLSEPWRLVTAHFVHLSWLHAVLNCVALLLLERLFEGRLRRSEQWIVLAVAPLAISLAFLLVVELATLSRSALLGLGIGALVLALPGAGALALVWLIAFYAIALGVLLAALGLRMRSTPRTADPQTV